MTGQLLTCCGPHGRFCQVEEQERVVLQQASLMGDELGLLLEDQPHLLCGIREDVAAHSSQVRGRLVLLAAGGLW